MIWCKFIFDFKDKYFFVGVNYEGDNVFYFMKYMFGIYNGWINFFGFYVRIYIGMYLFSLIVILFVIII